jgi:hypothetical protein
MFSMFPTPASQMVKVFYRVNEWPHPASDPLLAYLTDFRIPFEPLLPVRL